MPAHRRLRRARQPHPSRQYRAHVQRLGRGKKSFDIRMYADAPHGFLNDTMPGRFRPAQSRSRVESNHVVSEIGFRRANGKKSRAIWRFRADSSLDYDFATMKRWE